MFANRQEDVDHLLNQNIQFRRLYNKHQELDKKVHAAETGHSPMSDLALVQLKKEKLWAKDQLAKLLDA
ncbi:MAG: YdcH family protein [Lysobacterales bacterium]